MPCTQPDREPVAAKRAACLPLQNLPRRVSMRHSQSYRGSMILVRAEARGHGYAWRFTIEGTPAISGTGTTSGREASHGSALCEAMRAARLAIDWLQPDGSVGGARAVPRGAPARPSVSPAIRTDRPPVR